MKRKTPYKIIKNRYISEKSNVLFALKDSESNKCLKKCKKPKYVFEVDINANKEEIKNAVEQIYKNDGIKVKSVNTITCKSKPRVFRGRRGATKPFKKAIVTLREGDEIKENE